MGASVYKFVSLSGSGLGEVRLTFLLLLITVLLLLLLTRVGNETNSITGIWAVLLGTVAEVPKLDPGASPATPELGPGWNPSTGFDSRCCVVEAKFDDRALLFSKVLTFWVDGIGREFRDTIGREFGVNVCSGRGGATGGVLETGAAGVVTRLAPPGGKVWRLFSVGGGNGREWRPFLIGGKSTMAKGGSVDLPLLGPGTMEAL